MTNFQIIKRDAEGDVILAQGDSASQLITDARQISADDRVELEVIHAETGAVVAVTSPLSPGEFDPWTRVETPKFAAPHLADWRPAYTRKRVGAVVYRSLTSKSWMVLDTRTGGFEVVKTTAEARDITNRMRTAGYMIPGPITAEVAATA